MKLYIGQSRDVKVTQRRTKDDRTNLRRNNANNDVLWDKDEIYKIEIENFKKEAVNLTIVEHVPGYWKIIENSSDFIGSDETCGWRSRPITSW